MEKPSIRECVSLAKKKYPAYLAFLIWAIFSSIKGRAFINKYYPIGTSTIESKISQLGQQVSLVLAFFAAVLIMYLLCDLIYKGTVLGMQRERAFLLYTLPVFLILFSLVSAKFGTSVNLESFYQDDERLIWMSAVGRFPFLFVYTSFIYMVSFFLFPIIVAPTVAKVLLCSFIFGYLVLRAKEQYDTRLVYLLYALLILKSFWDYGVAVHRMHWYGWVYLFMATKLYFDSLDGRKHSVISIAAMEFIISLLTIWRREGIYLMVFGGALLCIVYAKNEDSASGKIGYDLKRIRNIIISFILVELLVIFPFESYERGGMSDGNVAWQAFFVHMIDQDDFDWEINAEDVAIVGEYMDVDLLKQYNEESRGLNANSDYYYNSYYDSYWQMPDFYDLKYYAIIGGGSFEDVKAAIIRMIFRQPLVFIKSRIRALGVAFWPQDSSNLYMPLYLTLALIIYSIYKRRLPLFLLSTGVIVHMLITGLLMPASYEKYFYELYLYGYVLGGVAVLETLSADHGKAISP